MAKIMRWILRIIFIGVMTLLSLEILLRLLDPWGAYAYLQDAARLRAMLIPTKAGYDLPAGSYDFSYWSFTIENSNRLVPATRTSACTIAVVGDSVTFGWGVDDEQTWVNRLAQIFPNVHFINAGKPSYNITNVRRTVEEIQADGYIYLIIDNDPEATHPFHNTPRTLTALESYRLFLRGTLIERRQPVAQGYDYANFWHELVALKREDVLLVLLSRGQLTAAVQERHPAVTALDVRIPEYQISRADAHLNPTGNQLVAQRMRPFVQNFLLQRCS